MKITLGASDIERLAPMPVSVAQLATLMVDPDVALAEVSRVIELDQALTANVLKMANSAWGSPTTPIQTIREAVVRLGTADILKLAVGRQLMGPMTGSCPGYGLNEHELWRHSVAAALAAEHLGPMLTVPVSKFAFTASLMHDIGKLLLERYLSREVLEKINRKTEDQGWTYLEAEQAVLGTDHGELGGEIARHWKFPEPIVKAITLHHDPDQEPDTLMDMVHLANMAAKLVGVGLGVEQMNLTASRDAPLRLGLAPSDLESLCVKVRCELEREESLYLGENPGAS